MIEEIKKIKSLDDLQKLYADTFGKNGTITARLKEMKNLSLDARAKLNAEAAELRDAFKVWQTKLEDAAILSALKLKKQDATILRPSGSGRQAAAIDVPADFGVGKLHPYTQALSEISAILTDMGYGMRTGPEVETEWYNFTALNLPEYHPARDMQATFYLENGNLLAPQTSPVQIRTMEKEGVPIKIFIPGAVYRVDMDATHIPMFHQFEGLVIGKDITMSDLVSDWKALLERYFGREFKSRIRPSYFPFTEPSIEVDVEWRPGKWLEMGGGGMVHPNVLKNAGVDPNKYQGFAFGLGFERLAMLKYGLNDLRKFYDGDVRWLRANGFDIA
ncbi:MAG: phenylalanine--tRNA ligase subunit alpha [Proteobacteria bacterium]|nr:phenylalanine--tRNA ligase subunit alpha [Pseudomonadota bacterium]